MNERTYLMACLRLSDGIMIVSKCKTIIAKHAGISDDSIRRHANDNGPYRVNDAIIYYDVELVKRKGGKKSFK